MMQNHYTKSIFILSLIFSIAFSSNSCSESEIIDSPITTVISTLIDAHIDLSTSSNANVDLSTCSALDILQASRFYQFNSEGMNTLMVDHCNVLGHFVNVEPISFAIYKGSCDDLVCVEHYGDLCGINGGEFSIAIEQHTDYYIAVYGPAVDFMFDLRLSFVLRNDNCENAIEVSRKNLYSSSAVHATVDGSTFCFVPSANVWYSFTTSATETHALISFCRHGAESIYDNFISLMKGDDCTSGTCVAFEDNSCGLSPELFIEVEPNTHYIFEIGTKGIKGEFTFYFDVVTAANDLCEIAEDITPGIISGSTAGASMDTISGVCGVEISESSGNIWYRFDSGDKINVSISTCAPEVAGNTNFDIEIFLFSGFSCNVLMCVEGANIRSSADNCENGAFLTASLTPNTTYYVAISGGGAGDFQFLFSME